MSIESVHALPANPPPDDDPPPVAPEPPLPSDCCESGCPICVHDLYAQELDAYHAALAEWRHPHRPAGDAL